MNDLGRLLDGEGSELERQLLNAGRAERPNPRRRQRAALAVSAALTVGFWGHLALGARQLWQTWAVGAPTTVKVVAVALLGGGAVAVWLVQPTAPTAAPAAGRLSLDAPQRMPVTPPASSAPEAQPLPSAQVTASSTPAPPVAPRASVLSSEVRAIDEARAALPQPTRALALLDAYAQSYPNGRLKQEALVLRVQALVGAGRREQATQLVRQFNREHPNSPYGQRLGSLLAPR